MNDSVAVDARQGRRLLVCASAGPAIGTEQDAVDLIGHTWGLDVEAVVVPVERLAPEFFDLSTRVAGAIVQKFVNYRVHLVILGDIAAHLARSSALAAFVRESNRDTNLWFVESMDELDVRLAGSTTDRGGLTA